MHEYSIVMALIEQCEDIALQNAATAVCRVKVKVGVMCGVEPALLQTAFETFKLDNICKDAEFEMLVQPLVINCSKCHTESILDERSIVCPHCLSYDTKVIDGEDLLLMQVELDT